MRNIVLAAMMMMIAVLPSQAVEFLGVELCTDRISTAVVLPQGSPLMLDSVEIGDQGALLLVLRSEDQQILDQIDDLMTGFTGSRGVGNEKSLQWSGRQITAFAQALKSKLAVLAVSTSDDCLGEPEQAPASDQAPLAVPSSEVAAPAVAGPGAVVEPAGSPAVIPAASVVPESSAGPVEREVLSGADTQDFSLEGALHHEAYADDWVDVMGVVVNHTAEGFKLATFDLSLWGEAGRLICVDAISVTILKSGQHRAFRDSIRCPGYSAGAVVRTELQFAGGN